MSRQQARGVGRPWRRDGRCGTLGVLVTDVLAAVRDPQRLAALRRQVLLDTPPSETFDRLTRLAARVLDAPVALLTLVDEDRQFFKSSVGLPEPFASARQTPLEFSICQYAVAAKAR